MIAGPPRERQESRSGFDKGRLLGDPKAVGRNPDLDSTKGIEQENEISITDTAFLAF